MWTPTALASESRPAAGNAWRVVEHQHTVSTRKVVDTQQEQALLEETLEESKPKVPAEADHLHYLLKTPFRYFPPPPHGSRFRRPHDGRGVFYCAEKLRTALAELSYWRRRFIEASLGTPLPRNHEALTVFSIAYQVDLQLDLTLPPLVAERHLWTHPDDYAATQLLAECARDGGVKAIRYESVRDPKHGANLALLTPEAFRRPEPLSQQTWYLYLAATESNCVRAGRSESFTFPVAS